MQSDAKWATSIEDDEARLEQLRSSNRSVDELGRDSQVMQFFLIYRIEQKKIVKSNFDVIDYLMNVVRRVKEVISGGVSPGDELFDKKFKEAYMDQPYG